MEKIFLSLLICFFGFINSCGLNTEKTSSNQSYDDIKIWKGGDIDSLYEGTATFEKFPPSFYKKLEERNLDIFSIIPQGNIILDNCENDYNEEELQECIEDDYTYLNTSTSTGVITAYYSTLYKVVHGFNKSINFEPHKTNHELVRDYLTENYSREEMLGWGCCKNFYNVLLENLDLWSFIAQMESD